MPNIVKTEYMNRPTIDFSEYFSDSEDNLPSNPKPGDRCIVTTGKIFMCVESGVWEELQTGGGVAPAPATSFEFRNLDGEEKLDGYSYGELNTRLDFKVGSKWKISLYENGEEIQTEEFLVEAGEGIYEGFNIIQYENKFFLVDGGVFNYESESISISASEKTGWRWSVRTDKELILKGELIEGPVITITENGKYDVSDYAAAQVAVEDVEVEEDEIIIQGEGE